MTNDPEILAPHPDDKSPLLEAAAKKAHPKESAHWYDLVNRRQIVDVPYANGKGMRKATLRDARPNGWGYGVTRIIGSAHRQQLVDWMRKQTCKTTAEYILECVRNGEDAATICEQLAAAVAAGKRAVPEWMERLSVIAERQDERRDDTADVGTEIHAALQAAIEGRRSDPADDAHVQGVLALLPTGERWESELCVVHSDGFDTKIDMLSDGWILDFKSKDGDQAEMDAQELWDDHYMQLAAGENAVCEMRLEDRQRKNAIVFISRTHPGACSLREAGDERLLLKGWEEFKALLQFRKARDQHYPCGTAPIPEF